MKSKYTFILVSLFGVIVLYSCKKDTASLNTKKAAIEVTAVPVTQQEIKEYLTFNGVTAYQSKEDIRASVTGYISGMRYKIGDRIRAGQIFSYVRTKEQDALKDALKIDSSLAKFISPITIKSNVTGIIKNGYVLESCGISKSSYRLVIER